MDRKIQMTEILVHQYYKTLLSVPIVIVNIEPASMKIRFESRRDFITKILTRIKKKQKKNSFHICIT